MSDMIKDPKMISALQDLGRDLNPPSDLAKLNKELLKITIEASQCRNGSALRLTASTRPKVTIPATARNGYNRKTLKGDHGEFEIATPRDRRGEFEPIFVAKNQTRLTQFDDQILKAVERRKLFPNNDSAMKVVYLAINQALDYISIFKNSYDYAVLIVPTRAKVSLALTRSRGRKGGAPYKMTQAKLRLGMVSMCNRETKISDLCKELGIHTLNVLSGYCP